MKKLLSLVGFVMGLTAVVQAAENPPIPNGNFLLKVSVAPGAEQTVLLINIESKAGKAIITVLDGGPAKGDPLVAESVVKGKVLRIDFKTKTPVYNFEGVLDPKAETLLGTIANDRVMNRARLVKTENDKIDPKERFSQSEVPEILKDINMIEVRSRQTQAKLVREKDAETKKQLQEEIEGFKKDLARNLPELKKWIDKNPENHATIDCALLLIRSIGLTAPKEADVKSAIEILTKAAARYGPRQETDIKIFAAEALVAQKGLEAISLTLAEEVSKTIQDSDPVSKKLRIYKLLKNSQEVNKRTEDAKKTEELIAAAEKALDEEYLKNVPPFKPEVYAGRKNKSANKVVVMELFTGAQCPPCVAADVGFDALLKTYKTSELILLQYHLHIPGPDPLTNAYSESRMAYYRKLFPGKVGGTPSTLFNGDAQAGGGGGMANAEAKYKQYRMIIDPMLEDTVEAKITGSVQVEGDKISASVEVSGAKGDSVKVHLMLVEDNIRYVGGNGLRFHHNVVRAPIGEAVEVKDGALKHTATVELLKVKETQKKYWEEFENGGRTFPNSDRPLELKGLKVVALVQNEKTGEILTATQMEVK